MNKIVINRYKENDVSTLILGAYLIVVGLVQTFSIPIPVWVMGVLALIAGILLVLEGTNNSYLVKGR